MEEGSLPDQLPAEITILMCSTETMLRIDCLEVEVHRFPFQKTQVQIWSSFP